MTDVLLPRHIAIEGPIGVGKSSLARRLAAHLGADLFLERPEENPFLARYYAAGTDDPVRNPYALQTQLFFLFQRLEQMRELAQPGVFGQGLVSDFLFAKDALFARLTLSDEDHALYTGIYRRFEPQVPVPDLVIWLRAPVPVLRERIARRAIPMEQDIAPDYLARLDAGYAALFEAHPGLPVLAIDTEGFNPVDRDEDFERLLDRLARFRGPREHWLGARD